MRTVQHTTYVHRPPQQVWDRLVDWPGYADWDSTFVAADVLPGTAPGGGPRLRWTMRVLGRPLTVTSEMQEWDPPRHMAYRAVDGPAPVRASRGWFDVHPAGDGCLVEAGYALAPGAGPAVRGVGDRVLALWGLLVTRRDLRRLRTVLERGEASPGPRPLHVQSVRVRRDADEVWAYLADLSHQLEWDGLTASCAVLGDGPLQEGTRFRWVIRLLGRRLTFETRLSAWDPPHRMDYVATSGPFSGSGWTQVHRTAEGCVVERGLVSVPGIGWAVARMPDALLVAWAAHLERGNLRRLRDLLERQPARI